ncbi:hypothetical protein T07_214 [Trichinella nelsoni]|uniref:Uncharacterized protein n=1 Tax=Trichinella nelsoni TaxID=6336 RepID=A0A0V0RHM5_9BILA|nr:hypothetical protein T07_214 [Trichinella nelsoni]
MLAITVNSGSKMLGRSTHKTFTQNFLLLLITTAVCYQVAVTWALDNTALGKNGVLYDKQNQTETMTRNISNQYLPKENAQNNNKTDVKETVFETPTEKENTTEFVIKAPLTPITLTPQTMTPILANFSEKVEPPNNRSKEHTDEILNVVNSSKTYENGDVSEKPKAGKRNGSVVELIETQPPNFVITSTLTPIICTKTVNYKGTNRNKKLNQTIRYIASCEEDHVEKFCIALSVIFAGMCLVAVIVFCVCFFQPTNMLRSIIERRRNGENHRHFCISTRAEHEMVSFGEKLNEV